MMMVGHGAVILPVPDGTPMGGYADRAGPSQGRIDDLQVRALVCADGSGATFALVVSDVVCINSDLVADCVAALRTLGVTEAWISATHTHSGPETGCQPGGGVTPEPWRRVLKDAVVAAVQSAMAAMFPAVATTHPCVVSRVAGIRSSPSSLIDIPLDVVAVRGADQKLAGLLVSVPIHSTVLPATNLAVSADLIGGIRAYLEQVTGAWVVVIAGAAGDISTRHGRQAQTVSELVRLSTYIAQRVVRALAWPGRTVLGITDRITVARKMLSVHVMPSADREALLATAIAALGPVDRDPSRSRDTTRQAVGMIGGLPTSGEVAIPLAVVRLGSLALCAVPGEPFLASAQQLRLRSHAATLLFGYTNGYCGYLPTSDRFGSASYEVLITPFVQGTAERIIDELIDMIHRLPDPISKTATGPLASSSAASAHRDERVNVSDHVDPAVPADT
ncbi:MAG: hypothetical protein ACR2KJ_16275 [Jatrophihabitans sp.]